MDELQKLYDLLVREGKYTKSFDEFKVKWSGEQGYQDKVFDVVSRDGFYTKDKGSFISKYGMSEEKKNIQPTSALAPTASSLESGSLKSKNIEAKPIEKDYFEGAFGDVLRGLDNIVPIGIGDFVDDMARSVALGYRQGTAATEADNLLLAGTKATPEQIQKFIDANKSIKQLGTSKEAEDYKRIYDEEGGGVWGFVKGIANNPSYIGEIMTSSLVGLATNADALKAGAAGVATGATYGGVTGAVAGGVGAIPGAVAGATASIPYAMGLAGSIMEMGSYFAEGLEEQLEGKEMTKENVKTILEDPQKLQALRNKAIARGAVIGAVDAFTGKMASKVGAKILTKSAAKSATGAATKGAAVRATAAGSGIEAVGGSTGEAAARAAIGQEMDTGEILMEGVAELPSGIRSTIQARLAKPTYKVNGVSTTAEEVDDIINTMSPADLAKTKIEIKNDYEGREFKIQDKIVTNSIMEQVREANPDLNEPSLKAITELEKQLQKLEGNKTQSGKDKAAEVRQQIKNIQENPLTEEVKVEEVVTDTTDKTKTEQDAIQEQGAATGVPSTEQPQLGLQEMGQGNAQPQGTPPGTQEVIAPEPEQEEELTKEKTTPQVTETNESFEGFPISVISGNLFHRTNADVSQIKENGFVVPTGGRAKLGYGIYSTISGKETSFGENEIVGDVEGLKMIDIRNDEFGDKIDELQSIASNGEGGVDFNLLTNKLKENGIDGVITDSEFVVFNPNKIQNIRERATEKAVSSKTQPAAEVAPATITEAATITAPEDNGENLETRNKIVKAYKDKSTIELPISLLEKMIEFDRAANPDIEVLAHIGEGRQKGPFDDVKKMTSRENIDRLKAKIKQEGFKGYLEISLNKKGAIALTEGNHRLQALKELGYENVPVKVLGRNTVKGEYFETVQNGQKRQYGLNLNKDFGINTLNVTPEVTAPEVVAEPVVSPVAEPVVEEEPVEQYEPITVKDTSYEPFTKYNATDYEEGEREADNGRTYTYLASITIPVMDADGNTIGYLKKLVSEDDELSFNAENLDGEELDLDGYETLGQAKQALVDDYNKTKKKEFDKEAKKAAKQKVKEAEKAAKKAEAKAAKDAAKAAAKAATATTTEAPVVTDTLEDLLDVDVTDKDNLDKIFNIIDKADKAITNRLRGGANDALLAIPLSTVQIVIKAVKALVKGGMLLRDAIKKVAADNNLTEKKVVDILNTKSNIKKLYRGTNTEEKSSKRLTWYSENKDFAKGFGDILNEKNVELGNIFDSTNPSNVQLLIDNGIELYNEYDDSYFNNADDAASYSDTWDFIENSYNAIDTIESLGFNSIKILEGGSNVNYIVIDEGGLESIDKVLDLDVKDKNNLNSVLKFIESVDKAISNRLRGGANDALLAIPLSTVQLVIKTLKTLVRGGMILRDAIKKVAADNNVSQQIVKDILNISEIQDKFDALMLKVDEMIARQRKRGTAQDRMVSNIDTYVRKSEVYQEANDAQKKILEREARARAGAAERRAPSIGRILGVLKDITNVSREDKLKIISQIRQLSKGAAQELAKELRGMASTGTITVAQAANILARFGKVNLLNEVSVSNFVDYMARVFSNAEYASKINYAKSKLSAAKRNVLNKIGIADGLAAPLMRLFSVNPSIIPDSVLDNYIELVKMFGDKAQVLTLPEKSLVTSQVNEILNVLDEEQSLVDTLLDVVEQYQNKELDANGNIDLDKTIKNMIDDGTITEADATIMRKYRTRFVPRASTKKTQQELDDEKNELLDDIENITVDGSGLSTKDERNLAKRIGDLIQDGLASSLSNNEIKNLLKVIDNINNNYIPHYAQVLVEKMTAVKNKRLLVRSIRDSTLLPLSKAIATIKNKITRRKNKVLTMIERNPLFYIDQLFGDFKTKNIFNSLFLKAAEGEAAFKSELKKVQELLEKAEEQVAKSFGLDPNKTLMSKYKMMTYMIQLEYQSNPNNEQVNEASKYLNETIKFIESSDMSRYTERDVKMLEEILDKYSDNNGEIDINKLYDSFNKAEIDAIKTVRGINESLKDKAEFTAAIIRGDRIDPLNNYVHLNVLQNPTQADASSSSPSDIANMSNMMNPSTKAKSLIKRTKGAKALNFDIFASAQRGAKFVLMDYNLTEPIRTARMTIKNAKEELEQNGRIPKEDRDIVNAIDSAFRRAVENLLLNSFTNSSIGEEVIDYISKQGYRAVLAGTTRFTSELLSNIGFALITDPKAMSKGVEYKNFMMSPQAIDVLQNVNSTETSRIYPSNTLSGKMVDPSILKQTGGIRGGKATSSLASKIQQLWNRSGKKYVNSVEFVADALISTPDKMIMRPMWFGSFANAFNIETGIDPDFDMIGSNDEAYMDRYKDAIQKAKTIADNRSVLTGATDNAFMGVLKGTARVDDGLTIKAFNNFNNYMTRFLIFEYLTARTGINAAIGNGSITKKQGVALIAGVTTRMVVYTLLTQMMGTGLMGLLFGGDEEEEEDDKSFFQKLGQQLSSAFTSLIFGRDFGQGVRSVVNIGVEEFNKEYLDDLRTGKYDPFKDAIQYSLIPPERKGRQTDLFDIGVNMTGSFGPAMKSADFIVRKALEPEKKQEDAIERTNKEIGIRIPLEILGNAGLIPMYKDIRKVVMKDIYKDLENAEKKAEDKKRAAEEKLQGYKNSEDMKRYDRKLWNVTFGPDSKDYDANEAKKKLKREKAKIERAIKDEMYDYTPQPSRRKKSSFGGGGFGSQSKRETGFGAQKKKGSGFGPQ